MLHVTNRHALLRASTADSDWTIGLWYVACLELSIVRQCDRDDGIACHVTVSYSLMRCRCVTRISMHASSPLLLSTIIHFADFYSKACEKIWERKIMSPPAVKGSRNFWMESKMLSLSELLAYRYAEFRSVVSNSHLSGSGPNSDCRAHFGIFWGNRARHAFHCIKRTHINVYLPNNCEAERQAIYVPCIG